MSKYSTKLTIVEEKDGIITLDNGLKLNMTKSNFLLMQLLQDYVLEILLMVDKFCREHNITYYLGEGTLLGALRHQGFIPWDDDIDILMPREDYNRFLELAKTELPEGYAIDSVDTNPKHSSLATFVQMTKRVPYVKKRLEGIALHNGPCLDIFALDYVPEEFSKSIEKRGKKIALLRRAIWIKSGLHTRRWYHSLRRRMKHYYPHKFYSLFHSLSTLHHKSLRIMTQTNKQNCDYIAMFTSLYNIKKEVFPKEYFDKPRYVNFEGHQLPIPAEAEKILTKIYGNYMAFPPLKKCSSKHFFSIDAPLLEEMKDTEKIRPVWEAIQEAGGVIPEPSYGPAYENTFKSLYKEFRKIGGTLKRKVSKKVKGFVKKIKRFYIRYKLSRYMRLPIQEKTVVYDAFSGLGILDSPRAIFKGLLAREEFKDFSHLWTIKDANLSKANMYEFRSMKNVKFIKRNSSKYLKSLCTAKYIICNSSLPQFFTRRPEQVYLNTWHGVPLKVMGYERPEQRVGATVNIVHNFLNATHLIAANHFTGNRMFKQAYMLDGIYSGRLLDEPLPRTDIMYNTPHEEICKKLNNIGIQTDKKIVLYAPTWKGHLYNSFHNDVDELKVAVKTLRDRIDTNEYNIYLRVHYFLYRAISMDQELSKMCIPFTIDTDELLSVVDILISDYSSIFFDFLGTKRPILFYVPDLKDYSENRGIYIPMDDMPGPVSENLEDISDFINRIEEIKVEYQPKYDAMYEWCSSKEDGKVVNRVIDDVFLNKQTNTMSCDTGKERIAILADFAKKFSNQEAILTVLDQIDYEKYDVSLITGQGKNKKQKEILENLNRNVRILISNKVVNENPFFARSIYKKLRKGTLIATEAADKLSFTKENQRITGGATFDKLFLVEPSTTREHTLLLSVSIPAKGKCLLKNEPKISALFQKDIHFSHFDKTVETTEDILEVLS